MQGWVVSIGGQKGGSAKSTVAKGLAVVAEKTARPLFSPIWISPSKRACAGRNGGKRTDRTQIDARLLRSLSGIRALQRLCDILIIDMPGRADVTTLNAAHASDLMILTTDDDVFELEPTVMLMHELSAAGLGEDRVAIALTKVLDAKRDGEARAYLAEAGYQALPWR